MSDDEKPNKKPKKIEVDDNFLKDILRVQSELKEELNTLKNKSELMPANNNPPVTMPIQPAAAVPMNLGNTALFRVDILRNSLDQNDTNQILPQFQKELDILMKKYRIVEVVARMYSSNI